MQRTSFIRCVKPNRERLPDFYDESTVINQLETSGTIAYHQFMQFSYPIKKDISELFKELQPILESRHKSFGAVNCCRLFLYAKGFSSKDFKIGKRDIHIRPGYQTSALDTSPLSFDDVIKIKQEFKFFMRRILKIRMKFLGQSRF